MEAENWLNNFKKYWLSKDLDKILSLFSDDVQYFETPFIRLNSKKEILNEWKSILTHTDTVLGFDIFAESGERFAVRWKLSYTMKKARYVYEGVYLIGLNDEGMCDYFYQTCESK